MADTEMANMTLDSPSTQLTAEQQNTLLPTTNQSSTTVSKPIPFTFDLGNLLCNDENPLPNNPSNDQIDEAARDCAQALINQLLSTCPITSTTAGVHITLPAPSTPLPREKPIPAKKEPTTWEKFAAKKGITKKKGTEGNKTYDEDTGEWVNKWGFGGVNKKGEDDWLVEVDDKEETRTGVAGDTRKVKREERKERVKRQDRKERANERKQAENHGKPRNLIIKVTHISPNHVDLLYAQGLHQNNKRHAKPPFTLGTDFAGTVLSPGLSSFSRGDAVYGSHFGAFCQYIIVDISKGEGGGIRRVPKSWSGREACAVGSSGATSLGCFLKAGGVKRGEWVLVTGATGGLGVMAVQIARALGGRVIALVGPESGKTRVLKSLGVEVCVRYDLPDWEEEVKKATGGEGVNLVYDAVGMVESSLKCCAYNGRVVIVGFAGRHGDIEKVRANRMLLKSASVMGYRFGEHGRRFPQEVQDIWKAFDEIVERGDIKAVVFDETYQGLNDIPRAMRDMEERKVWGRAVVDVEEEGNQTARL
ncbi:hypothetical protein EG327_010562 [Venturia inaequalis]|uniref:Enoyl reductase (ER) domain-containing protein n=1 Tax=Venturia inaequalis TaxID=5025 RepID=A0A8H3YUG7_VENIN|nr:hypothetical protein EG327_010562 [Venturia inaequalis]